MKANERTPTISQLIKQCRLNEPEKDYCLLINACLSAISREIQYIKGSPFNILASPMADMILKKTVVLLSEVYKQYQHPTSYYPLPASPLSKRLYQILVPLAGLALPFRLPSLGPYSSQHYFISPKLVPQKEEQLMEVLMFPTIISRYPTECEPKRFILTERPHLSKQQIMTIRTEVLKQSYRFAFYYVMLGDAYNRIFDLKTKYPSHGLNP